MEQILREQLLEVIHFFYSKNWAPATSANYSIRNVSDKNFYTISRSGVDKSAFTLNDFMVVDSNGDAAKDFTHLKPSAETLLHTMLYKLYPEVNCVLHTHSVANTVMSRLKLYDNYIRLSDYEILKGISGIATHEVSVELPIFRNSQDIATLSEKVEQYLKEKNCIPAFLLSSHGLYAWGKTIAEAKRHVEVIEFLLECEFQLRITNYEIKLEFSRF